jgi:hypothetical protein
VPAPSVQPQWDSNLTHTTATAAGHKTDGLGASEVPASDEFNYWMNLVYVWIAYLAGLLTRTNQIAGISGQGLGDTIVGRDGGHRGSSTGVTGDIASLTVSVQQTLSTTHCNDVLYDLRLPLGTKITAIRVYTDGANAPDGIDLDENAAGVGTLIATSTTAAAGVFTLSGLSLVTASTKSYTVTTWKNAAGAGGVYHVYSVEVDCVTP